MKRRAVVKTITLAIPAFSSLNWNGSLFILANPNDFYQTLVAANTKEV